MEDVDVASVDGSFAALSAREHASLANWYAASSLAAVDDGERYRAAAAAHALTATQALAQQPGDDLVCRTMLQNALTLLFSGFEDGDQAQYAELTLLNSQHALALAERSHDRVVIGHARANVGNAYYARRSGSESANIEQAIHHFNEALKDLPEASDARVDTTANLANAYLHRPIGAQGRNIEHAISCVRDVLGEVSRADDPEHWADLKNTLGIAHTMRAASDDDLHEAIGHFEDALAATQRERNPLMWADLHNNLSRALAELHDGNETANLAASIEHLKHSLEIYALATLPRSHLEIQQALGHKLLRAGRIEEAQTAFSSAIDASRVLFADAVTWTGRQVEIESAAGLFFRSAYCLARMNRLDESLARLEQGRTRVLNEALSVLEARDADETAATRIAAAQARVRQLEREHRALEPYPPTDAVVDLTIGLIDARQTLVEAVETVRPHAFDEPPTIDVLLAAIPAGGVLVAPVVTEVGTEIFVVPGGTTSIHEEHALHVDTFTLRDLSEILAGDEGWLPAYRQSDENPSRWLQTITMTCERLWDCLIGSIEAHMQTLGTDQAAQLYFLTPGLLGILPLHAATRPVDGIDRCLSDDYVVSYAPSLAALARSIEKAHELHAAPAAALVVTVPVKTLRFAAVEGAAVLSSFDENARRALPGAEATPKRIVEVDAAANYFHFACHGSWSPGRPLASALEFPRSELTLADVLASLDLRSTRLAVLSACETGLFEILTAADEELGLTTGFLQAGAAGVVSSLWPVDDIATMLLMRCFYGLMRGTEQLAPAPALRMAQDWLRTTTNRGFAEVLRDMRTTADGPQRSVVDEQFTRFALANDPTELPFEHPYYWAAFTVHGA